MDSKKYSRRSVSAPPRRFRRRPIMDDIPLKDNKKFFEQKQKPAPKETKASPPNFAKGGKVKKTGMAKVHKGEVVLTAAQAKRMKELFN